MKFQLWMKIIVYNVKQSNWGVDLAKNEFLEMNLFNQNIINEMIFK